MAPIGSTEGSKNSFWAFSQEGRRVRKEIAQVRWASYLGGKERSKGASVLECQKGKDLGRSIRQANFYN